MSRAYAEAIMDMQPKVRVLIEIRRTPGHHTPTSFVDAGPPPVDILFNDGVLSAKGQGIDYNFQHVETFSMRHVEI